MVAAVLILLCTQPLAAGPWAGNAWAVPGMTLRTWLLPAPPGTPAPHPAHTRWLVLCGVQNACMPLPRLVPSFAVSKTPACPCRAVIIGREITMSALREWAATMGPQARAAVAVSSWGKWKTATQVGCHKVAGLPAGWLVDGRLLGLLPPRWAAG